MNNPTPSASNNYTANLYPANPSQGSSTAVPGICFSGGGSRALSCALGQLSALSSLTAPNNPNQTLLSQFPYISSVSGGSWASVLYTFLPSNISDADFLITPLLPGSLTAANMSAMGQNCMGSVPQQFNPETVADFLYVLWNWGFFDPFGPDFRNWFWIAGVGELVLKPFGLYGATYSSSAPYLLPSLFFSLSPTYVQQNITSVNSSLVPSMFYTCRPNRPTLIVNTNLQELDIVADPPQIPIQATAIATGMQGQSPDGTIVGGGGVESFAFTSNLTGAGPSATTAAVAVNRCYSLCDIAGCSSAFFAEYLLQYVNAAVTDILDVLATKYNLKPWIADAMIFLLQALADSESSEVLPQYNYWPLGQVSQSNPQNATYGFSDGGTFENSGILGLLAQTSANRIIAFINTETPLSMAGGQVVVDSTLALLFGATASSAQVFSNANQEFTALCQGLYNASCGGPNQDSNLGKFPAVFTQNLVTIHNPVANITAGRQVTVLWVYNNRVNAWQDQITDATLVADLTDGQSNGSGPLWNFPSYDTVEQIYLAPEAVNMLAQLSAWTVQQIESQIATLLS